MNCDEEDPFPLRSQLTPAATGMVIGGIGAAARPLLRTLPPTRKLAHTLIDASRETPARFSRHVKLRFAGV